MIRLRSCNIKLQMGMLDCSRSINDKGKRRRTSRLFPYRFSTRISDFLLSTCSSPADDSSGSDGVIEEVRCTAPPSAPGVFGPAPMEDIDAAATRRAVKQLHFGESEDIKLAAAAEMKRLAAGDPQRKRMVAALGVVPPLVAMIVEMKGDDDRWKLVVETLVELAHGTFKNKTLIVEAGLLAKLPELTNYENLLKTQHLAPLLLSLSALAKTHFPIDPTQMLPLLIQILSSAETADGAKQACVAALYNVSTKLENIRPIVSNGAVHVLLELSRNSKVSEGALVTLGNLMLSEAGKKAVVEDPIAAEALMEVMAWEDELRCQELSAYILMVLAHQSSTQRQRMAELGIVPLVLEVALLGSPLSQKRALKILQCFKHEGNARICGHSGPQTDHSSFSGGSADKQQLRECRRAVKSMVKQSLDRNMQVIMRRASASEDFSCSKSLASTSSSKSLPY